MKFKPLTLTQKADFKRHMYERLKVIIAEYKREMKEQGIRGKDIYGFDKIDIKKSLRKKSKTSKRLRKKFKKHRRNKKKGR